MSRTNRGSKGVGYEFSSRRYPGYSGPGPYAKQLTHRRQRRIDQQICRDGDADVELGLYDPEEFCDGCGRIDDDCLCSEAQEAA